ncbi:MAG: hypothetical protein AABY16_03695 [Nanoarchaeota archaeon]
MTLEDKTVNWIDLGVQPYEKVIKLQDTFVKLRRREAVRDTIIAVQHPLIVNFGHSQRDNQFSDLLLARVRDRYGSTEHENVLRYLSDEGIAFYQSDRGGGATAFAPGQYVFYPIVKHSAITGRPSIDIIAYKSRIYGVLFDSLHNLGIKEIKVSDQQQFRDRNERRDVWLTRDGKTLKMGSKGIKVSGDVAYHGFVIYVDAGSVKINELVNQCGYRPDEVNLWTVEQELGRSIAPTEVYDAVRKAFTKNFGYTSFVERPVFEAVA